MSYLFDTDVLSNLLKQTPSPNLVRRLADVHPSDQFTSSITVGEMVYGALRTDRQVELLSRLERDVWPNVRVLPFGHAAAYHYGRVRAGLERSGTPLAEPDLRIAAIAIASNLTLVTGNTRHFSRVPGLAVENWLAR
jgi:tRNA(fMet)-specific endonuclease VapC